MFCDYFESVSPGTADESASPCSSWVGPVSAAAAATLVVHSLMMPTLSLAVLGQGQSDT